MVTPPEPTPAIVVGGANHGESHRVVRLLTADGRRSAFAPAARNSRRRFGGALSTFSTVLARFAPTRPGRLASFESVELLRSRFYLARDLDRLGLAAYASELSERLAQEGIFSPSFSRLEWLLDALETEPASVARRRSFELEWLDELGYRPDLSGCLVCGGSAVHLDLVKGGLLCGIHRGAAQEIGPRTLAWVEAVLDGGGPFGGLEPPDADRAARSVARSLDAALAPLLDRPLRSAQGAP